MTWFPVSTHLSIFIYTLELEKKSSVTRVDKLGLTVTFRLFLNARPGPPRYAWSAILVTSPSH